MKKNKIVLVLMLFLTAGILSGCNQINSTKQVSNVNTKMSQQTATIKTGRGDIKITLFPDKAPKTVENFVSKAKSGYYKDLIFHRVESWVVQGGDPLGNGTGGGEIATELSDAPFKIGSVGVARGGDIKVSNDSQFFICTDDCSWLTGQYTNFGEVTEGMDVVKSIKIGEKIGAIEVK